MWDLVGDCNCLCPAHEINNNNNNNIEHLYSTSSATQSHCDCVGGTVVLEHNMT